MMISFALKIKNILLDINIFWYGIWAKLNVQIKIKIQNWQPSLEWIFLYLLPNLYLILCYTFDSHIYVPKCVIKIIKFRFIRGIIICKNIFFGCNRSKKNDNLPFFCLFFPPFHTPVNWIMHVLHHIMSDMMKYSPTFS